MAYESIRGGYGGYNRGGYQPEYRPLVARGEQPRAAAAAASAAAAVNPEATASTPFPATRSTVDTTAPATVATDAADTNSAWLQIESKLIDRLFSFPSGCLDSETLKYGK